MKGHCHCGAVHWETAGPVAWTCYCHCKDCRRLCASPVTTFFGVPHTSITWLGTAPRVYHSSAGVERLFCGACGTQMAYRNADDRVNIHLYTATLKDPNILPPASHVYYAEHLEWFTIQDDLPRHDENGG